MVYSLERQCQELARSGSDSFLRWFRIGVVALTAGLLVGGIMTGHPWFYMGAAFCGFVTLAIWQTMPHIRHAARGLREGRWVSGTVDISIDTSPDTPTWHGVLRADGQLTWKMEFCGPVGWKPPAGAVPAEWCYLSDVSWPVLLRMPNGILYPRYKPVVLG
jgi:hypothetical protein